MSQKIKAQVIAAFNDRENVGVVYNVGDTFEGSQQRIDELTAGGYLMQLEEKASKAESKKEC